MKLLSITWVCFLFCAFAETKAQKLQIHGCKSVIGKELSLYKYKNVFEKTFIKSVTLVEDTNHIDRPSDEVDMYLLESKAEGTFILFIWDSNLTILVDTLAFYNSKVQGSALTDEWKTAEITRRVKLPLADTIKLINDTLRSPGISSENREKLQSKASKLLDKYVIQWREYVYEFIKNNKNSFVSLYWLSLLNKNILKEHVNYLSSILSDDLRIHSRFIDLLNAGNEIDANINKMQYIPEFMTDDILGNKVSNETLKGKYIVIDFWGTWCKPCLQSIPELVQMYNKFKNNNSWQMVSIAFEKDESTDKVKGIVQQNKMTWIQITDSQKDNSLTKKFGVYVFPSMIIVNKEGRILGVYTGETSTTKVFDHLQRELLR